MRLRDIIVKKTKDTHIAFVSPQIFRDIFFYFVPRNFCSCKMSDEWWKVFPAPRAVPSGVTAEEVMKMFDDMDIKPEPRPFLLVDVRRLDWEVRDLSFFFPFAHQRDT